MKTRKGWIVLLLAALLCIPSLVSQAATGPLVEVTALGFVDVDGAKIRAVALEYDQDMTGAQLSPDTYQLTLYEPEGFDEKGEGEIGDILAAYVNDRPEISENGGSGHGRYVILEVFTDYVASSAVAYSHAMQVKVDQVQAIETDAGTVPETAKTKTNHFGEFCLDRSLGFRHL